MNPAELTIGSFGDISRNNFTKATPASLPQTNGAGAAPAVGSKTLVERVNVEPIYTQLKSALGDNWLDYKAAISAFLLGKNAHWAHPI